MLNLSSDYPVKFHAIRIILHVSVSYVGEKHVRLVRKMFEILLSYPLKSKFFSRLKNVYSIPCVPNPHPQNSHAHTHCYNNLPCLTLKSILRCFLKLFHCMTLTSTLGPGEGAAATNQ